MSAFAKPTAARGVAPSLGRRSSRVRHREAKSDAVQHQAARAASPENPELIAVTSEVPNFGKGVVRP